MVILTMEEVAKHKHVNDCWIVIRNNIYDMTDFLSIHPGGSHIIMSVAGTDATEHFEWLHREDILQEVGHPYMIGPLEIHMSKL